jgi:oxygen-independent coproporphyrinogen-3 oxidase
MTFIAAKPATASAEGLYIPEEMRPLTRLIARAFDAYDLSKAGHSSAI